MLADITSRPLDQKRSLQPSATLVFGNQQNAIQQNAHINVHRVPDLTPSSPRPADRNIELIISGQSSNNNSIDQHISPPSSNQYFNLTTYRYTLSPYSKLFARCSFLCALGLSSASIGYFMTHKIDGDTSVAVPGVIISAVALGCFGSAGIWATRETQEQRQ